MVNGRWSVSGLCGNRPAWAALKHHLPFTIHHLLTHSHLKTPTTFEKSSRQTTGLCSRSSSGCQRASVESAPRSVAERATTTHVEGALPVSELYSPSPKTRETSPAPSALPQTTRSSSSARFDVWKTTSPPGASFER